MASDLVANPAPSVRAEVHSTFGCRRFSRWITLFRCLAFESIRSRALDASTCSGGGNDGSAKRSPSAAQQNRTHRSYDVQGEVLVPARDATGREIGFTGLRMPAVRVDPDGLSSIGHLVAPLDRCQETTIGGSRR